MSSIDFNVKITGYEAKEWIRNILGDAEEGRIYDEEDFMTLLVKHKPVDFKAPRKSRASKVSSSDRSEAEYDCQLCDARVWNHVDKAAGDMRGLGGQCSRLKKEDECLCVIHIRESGKHDGLLRNGYINGPRPVHAYGDETQEFLKWHDVELPDKPVKKTSSGAPKGGKRKCSNCGETGHNKKTCSLLKGNKVVEEVKVVLDEIVDSLCAEEEIVEDAKVVLDEIVDWPLAEEVTVEESLEQEPEDEPEPEPEPEDEDETEDENEPEPEDEEEEVVEEVVAKKVVAKKAVAKKAIVAKKVVQKKEVAKKVAKKEEPVEEESLVTEDTELDEDESGNIVFEGIEYTLDSEENEVYDDELSVVGTWCPETETVSFINATEEKLHRVRKLGLKKLD